MSKNEREPISMRFYNQTKIRQEIKKDAIPAIKKQIEECSSILDEIKDLLNENEDSDLINLELRLLKYLKYVLEDNQIINENFLNDATGYLKNNNLFSKTNKYTDLEQRYMAINEYNDLINQHVDICTNIFNTSYEYFEPIEPYILKEKFNEILNLANKEADLVKLLNNDSTHLTPELYKKYHEGMIYQILNTNSDTVVPLAVSGRAEQFEKDNLNKSYNL